MSRIAPNLSKDYLDVSSLGDSPSNNAFSPNTNRRHIRVSFAARGIRFGSLVFSSPHSRIPQTMGYTTSPFYGIVPYPPSAEISQPFVAEEPWTRVPPSTLLTNSGVAQRRFDSIPAGEKVIPWLGSTYSSGYYLDPADAYNLRPACSLQIAYRYLDAQGNWTENLYAPEPRANIPVVRDSVFGVSTAGAPSAMYSALIHDLPIENPYPIATSVIRGTGRFWTTTEIDRFGNLENTLTTKVYQFVRDLSPEQSRLRKRWAWVDSKGGVKELRMMTRRKSISVSTYAVQTRTRQWMEDGAGGAVPIAPGQEIHHRTATNDINFPGDTDPLVSHVPWIDGVFPGHPTFDLAAFETAVNNGDASAVSSLVAVWPGAFSLLPFRSQYKWHRFRFEPKPPTWGAAKSRLLGWSDRTDHGQFSAFNVGVNPRPHNSVAADDHEIDYPWAEPAVDEREASTSVPQAEVVRTSTSIETTFPPFWDLVNYTISPYVAVTAINLTQHHGRGRSRSRSRTASPPCNITEITTSPMWQWQGFLRYYDDGGNVPKTFRMYPRLRMTGIFSPFGQADAVLREFPWGQAPTFSGYGNYWNAAFIQFPVPVEGWNANRKPTITPNPIVCNHVGSAFGQTTVSLTVSPPISRAPTYAERRPTFEVATRVQSSTLSPKNLRIQFSESQMSTQSVVFTMSVRHCEVSVAGSFTFSVRFFDGVDYSDPIPVTINVLPF